MTAPSEIFDPKTNIPIVIISFRLRHDMVSIMNNWLILEFGMRILDLRNSAYFINGKSEAIPPIQNPKSNFQNLQSETNGG